MKRCLGVILILIFPITSPALDPNRAITQYVRGSWDSESGLPNNHIYSMYQTRDGYLWVATGNGLGRFDGVRFELFDSVRVPEAFTAPEFFCLLESPDGTFWIGSYWGGLIAYKEGRFRKFGKADGLTDERIVSIEQDRNGFLWLGTPDGLFRMKDGKFKRFWKEDGLPGRVVWAIEEDHNDKLWLATVGGGLYYRQGERFVRYAPVDVRDILSLHADRKNNLWVGTDEGLFRVQNDKVSRFTKEDGLASGIVRALVEDSDGNIWIGETTGLSRLNNGTIRNITKDQGFPQAVRCLLVDREGTLWAGTTGGGLFSFRDGKIITFSSEEGLNGDLVNYVEANREGEIWVATNNGINKVRQQASGYTIDQVAADHRIVLILEDSQKRVWLGVEDRGLSLLRDNRLEQFPQNNKLLGTVPWAFHEDHSGNVWVAFFGHGMNRITEGILNGSFSMKTGLPTSYVLSFVSDGENLLALTEDAGILRFEKEAFSTYISQADLEHQAWTAYYDDEKVLWIATLGGGLKRYKNGTLKTIGRKDGLVDDTIQNILQDSQGNFWMNCQKGIFSVSKKQLNEFADGKISKIQCALYSKSDGMKSSETIMSGVKAPDGRLWVGTSKGVAIVDPSRLARNPVLPPVHIEKMVVDDRSWDEWSAKNLQLKPGSEKIEFHYTALSFADPAKVRFKYKLEGFDHAWVDAETRRVAYYTHIPPGSYNFRVLACNNDDVWNEAGASLTFDVKPHFYQTIWFYMLCTTAVFGAAIGLHRQKMRKANREFVVILSERARIAREIHDGLTQALAGVVMQLETVRLLPAGNQAEKHLDRALELARKSVEDARRTIGGLRPQPFSAIDFPEGMRSMVRQQVQGSPVELQFEVKGNPVNLRADAQPEILRICQESVQNALKHSNGSKICVELHYERGRFRMIIQDNGKGLDRAFSSPGHFGLQVLQERSVAIKAQLLIDSVPKQGTRVELIVPA